MPQPHQHLRLPPFPPDDNVVPLRPYGLGEVLKGAFRVYRRVPARMLLAGICAAIPLAVVALVLSIHAHPAGGNIPKDWRGEVLGAAVGLTGLYCNGVAGLLSLLLAAGYSGRGSAPWSRSAMRFPVLITIWVAATAAGFVLSITIVGGIWVYIRWSMAPYVALAEGVDSVSALRRSWQLMNNNWWRVFGYVIVLQLITSAVPSIFFDVFTMVTDDHHQITTTAVVVLVIGLLLTAVLMPFAAASTALIYIDLRARTEGLAYMLDASRKDPDVRPAFGRSSVYAPTSWSR